MAVLAALVSTAQVTETDVTNLITNPSFEDGLNGWTNNGMQTQTNNEFTGKNGTTTYCEKWTAAPNALPDSYVSQTISLENGVYRFSAMCGATQQGDSEVKVEGVFVYANAEEVLVESAPTQAKQYNCFVEVTNGSMTIGFKTVNTTANWIAWDETKLFSYGNASMDAVKTYCLQQDMLVVVEAAQDYLGEPMQDALRKQFMANADKIESVTTEAAATELLNTLTSLLEEIKACVDVYAKAKELLEKAEGDYEDWKTDAAKLLAAMEETAAAVQNEELGLADFTTLYQSFSSIYDDFLINNLDPGNDGIDYTNHIINASVRTSSDGWTVTTDASSKSINFNTMEFWKNAAYSCEISQTIEGLPNGKYQLSVTAFCRAAGNDSGAAYSDGTENITAELFANRKSAPIHSLYEHGADEFASTGNLNGYADNMENASLAFDAGLYGPFDANGNSDGHNLVDVVVTNGTLTIGLRNSSAAGYAWHIFRDFKLTYFGNFPGVLLAGLIEEIQSYLEENADVLLLGVGYELNDAAIMAQDYVSDGYEKEEVQAAYDELETIFANAKKTIEVVEQIKQLMAKMEELANLDYPGVEDLMSAYSELSFIVDEGGDDDTTCEVVFNYLDMANEAILAYYKSQEASHEKPADYTFLINNPTLRESSFGWSGSAPSLEYNVMEFYNCDFDMYQEMDVDNGKYRITVTGFYREAGNDGGAAHAAGTENLSAKLYANLSSTSLMSLYTHTATDMGISSDQVLNDYVNMRVSTSEAFDNGFYQGAEGVDAGNVLDVIVYDGKLRFGVRNSSHQASSWCTFRDFTLQYFGPATEEDMLEAWTAAQTDADNVASVLLPGDAVAFNASYAEAKALAAEGKYLEACALINPVVQDYQTVYGTTLSFRKGNYQKLVDMKADASSDVISVIDKTLSIVDAALLAEDATTDILPDLDTRLGGYVTYMEAYIDAEAEVSSGTYPQSYAERVTTVMANHRAQLTDHLRSAESTSALLAELKDAVNIMHLSSVVFNLKPGDVTSALLQNPALDVTNGEGWTVEKGTGNGPTISGQHYSGNTSNYYLDSWNGSAGALNFSAFQTLRGVPNGTYELSCAARSDGDNSFIFAAVSEDFADESTLFEPIRKYAAERGELWEADSLKWVTDGTETDIYNANGGVGWGWSIHKISDIKVTNHLLTIGMSVNSAYTGKSFTGTWYSTDDWKLVLVEKGPETSWEIVSHVNNATLEPEVVGSEYYSPSGARLAEPQRGLLIVRHRLSDGSVRVEKVLIR